MEQTNKIHELIEKLNDNDFAFYFFTLDTKGNPTAGIANIYEHVKVLNELGYTAKILHEKNDYKLRGDENGMGIADWLGEEYANLPHVAIEGQGLNITAVDFLVIPEIFANIMDQVKQFPCKKIVLAQSYDYLLELLPLGKRWNTDFGFHDVITTSDNQANYLKALFPSITTHIIPVAISDEFKPSDKPKKPMIVMSTRNQGDATKIAKSFYLQYPIYKWLSFKELRGLPRNVFAKELAESCLAIWIDEGAGFGTFPLEAFECETPVIGRIPQLVPEWLEGKDEEGNPMIKANGIWTNTNLNIPELIATYIKIWLEDSVPADLLESIKESKGQYTSQKQKTIMSSVYSEIIQKRIKEYVDLMDKTAITNETPKTEINE